MNDIANIIDLETNGPKGRIIEVGLTTLDLKTRQILNTYSFPVRYTEWEGDLGNEVLPEVTELTGWTKRKLEIRGESLALIIDRLKRKFGSKNRLCVVDHGHELKAFGEFNPFGSDVLNVSVLHKLMTKNFRNSGLPDMLKSLKLEFEGQLHRASDDSKNIARLLIGLLQRLG